MTSSIHVTSSRGPPEVAYPRLTADVFPGPTPPTPPHSVEVALHVQVAAWTFSQSSLQIKSFANRLTLVGAIATIATNLLLSVSVELDARVALGAHSH